MKKVNFRVLKSITCLILKRKAVITYSNPNTVIRKNAHPFFIDNPIANITLYALTRPKSLFKLKNQRI